MKFIADENLGVKVPRYLRSFGIDIVSIKDLIPGKSDQDVLALANQQKRILITMDKDFGELVFKEKLVHKGVILLRLKDESVENKKKVLLKLLKLRKKLEGRFTVVKDLR